MRGYFFTVPGSRGRACCRQGVVHKFARLPGRRGSTTAAASSSSTSRTGREGPSRPAAGLSPAAVALRAVARCWCRWRSSAWSRRAALPCSCPATRSSPRPSAPATLSAAGALALSVGLSLIVLVARRLVLNYFPAGSGTARWAVLLVLVVDRRLPRGGAAAGPPRPAAGARRPATAAPLAGPRSRSARRRARDRRGARGPRRRSRLPADDASRLHRLWMLPTDASGRRGRGRRRQQRAATAASYGSGSGSAEKPVEH